MKNLYCPENLHEIFDRKVDYIIDAIDTVTAKLALVEYAKQQDIPDHQLYGNRK